MRRDVGREKPALGLGQPLADGPEVLGHLFFVEDLGHDGGQLRILERPGDHGREDRRAPLCGRGKVLPPTADLEDLHGRNADVLPVTEVDEPADAAFAQIIAVGPDVLLGFQDVEDVVADLDHVVEAARDGGGDDLVLVDVAGQARGTEICLGP